MKKWFNYSKIMIAGLILLTGVLTGFLNVSGANEQSIPTDRRVAVLTFHSVSQVSETNPVKISQDELEKTFKLMLEKGYHPISLDQFHGFIDGNRDVPDKAVLITFDDGYEDNYLLAHPLAIKYEIPCTVFTVAKWFSDYPRPEPHIPHLKPDQVRTMVYDGLWSVGNHSFDGHRKLPGVKGPGSFYTTMISQPGFVESEAEYKARIWNDISLGTFTLESLDLAAEDFAFPFGSYNDTVREILTKSGYKYFYTNEPGLNKPGQDPTNILRNTAATTADQNLALLDRLFLSSGTSAKRIH